MAARQLNLSISVKRSMTCCSRAASLISSCSEARAKRRQRRRNGSNQKIGGPNEHYLGLESGGQSGDTLSGLPPLCTVGAAELDPPASGNTALFSTDIEFAVFSSPLPVVAAGDVVQAVSGSGLSPDVPVDWAAAALTLNATAKIAAATRTMSISEGWKELLRRTTSRCRDGSGKATAASRPRHQPGLPGLPIRR